MTTFENNDLALETIDNTAQNLTKTPNLSLLDIKQPDYYINRELSLLEFNRRVLEQATDATVPLLERLRYLCISSTNLDEFFEVRVASLIKLAELGSTQAGGPDNMLPHEVLKTIRNKALELVREQYYVLNEIIFPALANESIRIIRRSKWTNTQAKWLHQYFEEELLPILSPIGLDSAHPFPRILNKGLHFIISLEGKGAFGRNIDLAILQAPRALPRIIRLPAKETASGPYDFVYLSSVIHAYIDEVFHGMRVKGCYQFRVTRNSELFVSEEEMDNLLRAVEGELAVRNFGDSVRLEVVQNCPNELVDFLLTRFQMSEENIYQVDGPVNLSRLEAIYELVDKPELKFQPFTPGLPSQLLRKKNIFNAISKKDILLHHPFESFAPVVDFIQQAAVDPKVLVIKQTLYRTGPESVIVDALVEAAQAGKEVTVVIELRARFDERDNIALANRLQEAGANIIYGIVGYKTHAKMTLVVRRENKVLRHYVHLGTGNYHQRTSRLYTDYGLFTADKEIGQDVHKVFFQLTSLGKVSKLSKLLRSPFNLHKNLLEKIDAEIECAKKGQPARIIFKVNSLTEPTTIQALYKASMAGVQVDLIVRGICSLRPGIQGISQNIHVRSIVGRFLEHTRIYYFKNNGDPLVYGSSADLMDRNLFRRVEICFPILTKQLKQRIIKEVNYYLQDNMQAHILQKDGTYIKKTPTTGEKIFSAQEKLLKELTS